MNILKIMKDRENQENCENNENYAISHSEEHVAVAHARTRAGALTSAKIALRGSSEVHDVQRDDANTSRAAATRAAAGPRPAAGRQPTEAAATKRRAQTQRVAAGPRPAATGGAAPTTPRERQHARRRREAQSNYCDPCRNSETTSSLPKRPQRAFLLLGLAAAAVRHHCWAQGGSSRSKYKSNAPAQG